MIVSKRTYHQLAVLAEVNKVTIEEFISIMAKWEFEDLDTYNSVRYDEYLNWKVENHMIDPRDTVEI